MTPGCARRARWRDCSGVFAVPPDLQRLVDEIDGWLDLRCPDQALQRVQPLLDRADARPEGLALRVRACVMQKQHRAALVDLQELRRTDYDPEWLDLTEAWCKKRVQDLPGAVQCMEQLVARTPRSAIGHFNLGCYLALCGNRERALDEVTLACGIDRTFRDLLWDEPDLDSLHKDPRFKAMADVPAGDDSADDSADDSQDDDEDDDDSAGDFEDTEVREN